MSRYTRTIYMCFSLMMILIIFSSLTVIERTNITKFYDAFGNTETELRETYSDSVPGTGTCSKSNFYGDKIVEEASFRKLLNLCRKGMINGTISNDKNIETRCEPRTPQFLQEDRPLVALASFPGSGNSWARELLESLTGIYTGSMYNDGMSNFTGSKRCPSGDGVYIIKTHYGAKYFPKKCKMDTKKELDVQKVILIIRDPYDALIAEYNRRRGGKIKVAEQEVFQSDDLTPFPNVTSSSLIGWKRYVESAINHWSGLFTRWLKGFEKPSYVLVYEDLKSNTLEELYNIANFLQENVTYTTLYCTAMEEKDQYKRVSKPYWLNKYHLFDKESRDIINSKIYQVIKYFEDRKDLMSTLKKYIF